MNEQATPDQMLGAAMMGSCCCVLFGIAFVAVLISMFRNKASTPVQYQQQGQQQQYTPPPPVAPPDAAFHLSVIALAFDGYFRPQVESVLNAPFTATDPVGMRVEMGQRAARALLGVEPQWRHFGYGEKDLADLPSAQSSFNNAVADFRGRIARPDDGGALVVLTLILCTRGRRLGVDRLDTRAQVHDLLGDRLKVDATTLLGAEVMVGPATGGLTEFAVKERFPEMHTLI